MNAFYYYFLKYIKRFIWLSPFIFYLNGWGSNSNCKHLFSDVHLNNIKNILKWDQPIQKRSQASKEAAQYFSKHKYEMNRPERDEANNLIKEFKEKLNTEWEKHKAQSLTHLNEIKNILKVDQLIVNGNKSFKEVTQYFSKYKLEMTPDNKDEASNLIKEFKEKLNKEWEKHKDQSLTHLNKIKNILRQEQLPIKEPNDLILVLGDLALTGGFFTSLHLIYRSVVGPDTLNDLKASLEHTRGLLINAGKTIDQAQQYFSSHKHEMVRSNRDEAFNLIKNLREALNEAWKEYKEKKEEIKKKYRSERRKKIENFISRKTEWISKMQAVIEGKKETISKMNEAIDRKEKNINNLEDKIEDSKSDKFIEKATAWIKEDKNAIENISLKITKNEEAIEDIFSKIQNAEVEIEKERRKLDNL